MASALRAYLSDAFRWRGGRQRSGYERMLLAQGWLPLPFDLYLLRFPAGSEVRTHTDRVESGDHYRLNIILRPARRGGEFRCADPIFVSRRIKLFRPDRSEHSVTRIESGTRYVLSLGWVLRGQGGAKPAA
ncbi:MAG: hypothetical protein OSA97_13300 [Nevskia sp.]|nr:hypothetical protein [Nevskia sp.]